MEIFPPEKREVPVSAVLTDICDYTQNAQELCTRNDCRALDTTSTSTISSMKCPVCLNELLEAVLLPCQHFMCSDPCVSHCFDEDDGVTLKCPVCSAIHNIYNRDLAMPKVRVEESDDGSISYFPLSDHTADAHCNVSDDLTHTTQQGVGDQSSHKNIQEQEMDESVSPFCLQIGDAFTISLDAWHSQSPVNSGEDGTNDMESETLCVREDDKPLEDSGNGSVANDVLQKEDADESDESQNLFSRIIQSEGTLTASSNAIPFLDSHDVEVAEKQTTSATVNEDHESSLKLCSSADPPMDVPGSNLMNPVPKENLDMNCSVSNVTKESKSSEQCLVESSSQHSTKRKCITPCANTSEVVRHDFVPLSRHESQDMNAMGVSGVPLPESQTSHNSTVQDSTGQSKIQEGVAKLSENLLLQPEKPPSKKAKLENTSCDKAGFPLLVSGLPQGTKAVEVKKMFAEYGKVLSSKIVGNTKEKSGTVYAQIIMDQPEECAACISNLHSTQFNGNKIKVKKVKPKIKQPATDCQPLDTKDKTTASVDEKNSCVEEMTGLKADTSLAESEHEKKNEPKLLLTNKGRVVMIKKHRSLSSKVSSKTAVVKPLPPKDSVSVEELTSKQREMLNAVCNKAVALANSEGTMAPEEGPEKVPTTQLPCLMDVDRSPVDSSVPVPICKSIGTVAITETTGIQVRASLPNPTPVLPSNVTNTVASSPTDYYQYNWQHSNSNVYNYSSYVDNSWSYWNQGSYNQWGTWTNQSFPAPGYPPQGYYGPPPQQYPAGPPPPQGPPARFPARPPPPQGPPARFPSGPPPSTRPPPQFSGRPPTPVGPPSQFPGRFPPPAGPPLPSPRQLWRAPPPGHPSFRGNMPPVVPTRPERPAFLQRILDNVQRVSSPRPVSQEPKSLTQRPLLQAQQPKPLLSQLKPLLAEQPPKPLLSPPKPLLEAQPPKPLLPVDLNTSVPHLPDNAQSPPVPHSPIKASPAVGETEETLTSAQSSPPPPSATPPVCEADAPAPVSDALSHAQSRPLQSATPPVPEIEPSVLVANEATTALSLQSPQPTAPVTVEVPVPAPIALSTKELEQSPQHPQQAEQPNSSL